MLRFARALMIATVIGCGAVQAQDKKVVSTSNAPEAIGPYSQAIRAGNTLYLAGQIPIDPKTKQLMKDASIEEQTKLVLDNLKAVLEADGMSMANIVSTTVYLKDLNEFSKMNEVYGTYFRARHRRVRRWRSQDCRVT